MPTLFDRCDYCGEYRDENHDEHKCAKFLRAMGLIGRRWIRPFRERSAASHKELTEFVEKHL